MLHGYKLIIQLDTSLSNSFIISYGHTSFSADKGTVEYTYPITYTNHVSVFVQQHNGTEGNYSNGSTIKNVFATRCTVINRTGGETRFFITIIGS